MPSNLVENRPHVTPANSKPKSIAASAIAAFKGTPVSNEAKPKRRKSVKSNEVTQDSHTLVSTDANTATETTHAGLANVVDTASKKRKRSEAENKTADTKSSPSRAGAAASQPVKAPMFSAQDASPVDTLFGMLESQFKPAPLSKEVATRFSAMDASVPLWLFQFPAGFDVAAFARLSVAVPAATSATRGAPLAQFELNDAHYEIIEGDSIEASDLISLFPAPAASQGKLALGRPFTRVFHIRAVIGGESELPMPTIDAITHQQRVAPWPKEQLKINFTPIGAIKDAEENVKGTRRGKNFRSFAYDRTAHLTRASINESSNATVDGSSSKRRKTESETASKPTKHRHDSEQSAKKERRKEKHRERH